MNDFLRYRDRVAVVTGCASGVGAETARLLKEAGARVIGLDLKAVDTVDDFIKVDLSDPESIASAAMRIDAFDCLFNVAGVSSGAGDPVFVVTVNFLGARLLTQLLLPRMIRGGAVANVTSVSASRYLENLDVTRQLLATVSVEEGQQWCRDHPTLLPAGGYALSKEAVIVHTVREGLKHGGQGIRFNCVGPGVIETPFIADTLRAKGPAALDAIPKPLARISRPAEQAAALVFLNSPAASYVNAHVLWVDGGTANGRLIGEIA